MPDGIPVAYRLPVAAACRPKPQKPTTLLVIFRATFRNDKVGCRSAYDED